MAVQISFPSQQDSWYEHSSGQDTTVQDPW